MNPDPLAQLRDIHLPEAVGPWPPAPGWWLLTALVLLAVGWALWRLYRHRRSQRYRRQALARLAALPINTTDYPQQLNRLLKQAALATYPRREVAALSGEPWLQFLDRSGKTNAFTKGEGRVLACAPYTSYNNSNYDPQNLLHVCQTWLQQHQGGNR